MLKQQRLILYENSRNAKLKTPKGSLDKKLGSNSFHPR
jgi:hypothetical protein